MIYLKSKHQPIQGKIVLAGLFSPRYLYHPFKNLKIFFPPVLNLLGHGCVMLKK